MKYLLIHYVDESTVTWFDDDVPDDPQEDRDIEAWDDEMKSRGILVGGGGLRSARTATTLRVRGGEVLVSDGPFAETKEQMAGYSILECVDLDEAIEVSSRHPTAKVGVFELRPFWE
ncbi:MAG TPA: YciI family protein [Streptosporangiaceae bacterium]|nr:YciI family protein [Streptosporangiaceae bacterium]